MINYKIYNDEHTTLELCGQITYEGEWSVLGVGRSCLTDEIENILELSTNNRVRVKYYISNKPINPYTIEEDFLKTFYGIMEIDTDYLVGTEWTGIYGKEDLFSVDGHNIIEELNNHISEYCYIKIEKV
jgi:hypothetical protein